MMRDICRHVKDQGGAASELFLRAVGRTSGPVFSNQFKSMDENTASGVIHTLNSGGFTVSSYEFTATGTTTSADGFLTVAANGEITLTASGAASELNDYETGDNVEVYSIDLIDTDTITHTADLTVNTTDVDEQAPTFAAQDLDYTEGHTASSIGTLVASDNVAIVSLLFDATGTGTSADGFFTVDSAGEVFMTASGVTSDLNDFDTGLNTGDYDINAADAQANETTATLTVNCLEDTADVTPPTFVAQNMNYIENQTAGVVGTLTASDNVGITSFEFVVTGTNTSSDGYYTVETNGQVSITASGVSSNMNDYETGTNTVDHDIEAFDAAANSTTATITFNVTDVDEQAPTFADQDLDYDENQTAGVIGTLTASDNVAITSFEFTSTGTNTSSDGFYTVASNGQVSITASGVSSDMNDFESGSNTVDHDIEAFDAAGNSTTATITFNVDDVVEGGGVIFSFTTTGVDNNITPAITVSSGTAEWDFGDTNTATTNSANHTYSDGESSHDVEITGGVAATDVTVLSLSSDEITAIDLSACTGLTSLYLQTGNDITGVLALPNAPNLTLLWTYSNNNITDITGFDDLSSCSYYQMQHCSLSAAVVARIIIEIAAHRISSGTRILKIHGTNAAPTSSAALTTALANLATDGWTVTTN